MKKTEKSPVIVAPINTDANMEKKNKGPRGTRMTLVDIKKLREILAPVYYRHEFARREKFDEDRKNENESDAVRASKVVMKLFKGTDALIANEGYVRWEDGECKTLVQDLMMEFYGTKKAATQEEMRRVLGAYTRTFGLLPVLPPSQTYFPQTMGFSDELKKRVAQRNGKQTEAGSAPINPIETELMAIWCSIVQYETFLLAEGMRDTPCFMPMVPLPPIKRNPKEPGISVEQLGKLPVGWVLIALKTSEKRGVLDINFNNMITLFRVINDSIPQKEFKSVKRRGDWYTVETYLQAHKYANTHRWKDGMQSVAVKVHKELKGGKPVELVQENMEKGTLTDEEKLSRKQKQNALNRALGECRKWLVQANKEIDASNPKDGFTNFQALCIPTVPVVEKTCLPKNSRSSARQKPRRKAPGNPSRKGQRK